MRSYIKAAYPDGTEWEFNLINKPQVVIMNETCILSVLQTGIRPHSQGKYKISSDDVLDILQLGKIFKDNKIGGTAEMTCRPTTRSDSDPTAGSNRVTWRLSFGLVSAP
jgi:hypothetical protein